MSDIKIIDSDTRKELRAGKAGLLLVRGPQVMKRYEGNPEATEAAIDRDGWLDTGDIAEVDEEGFVYIRDRRGFFFHIRVWLYAYCPVKDIIIRGGENVRTPVILGRCALCQMCGEKGRLTR